MKFDRIPHYVYSIIDWRTNKKNCLPKINRQRRSYFSVESNQEWEIEELLQRADPIVLHFWWCVHLLRMLKLPSMIWFWVGSLVFWLLFDAFCEVVLRAEQVFRSQGRVQKNKCTHAFVVLRTIGSCCCNFRLVSHYILVLCSIRVICRICFV